MKILFIRANPVKPDAEAVRLLKKSNQEEMCRHNQEKVKGYSTDIVRQELYDIYKEVLA